jgi:hypothetical protein
MTWWRTSRRVWGCARTVRGVPWSKSPRGGFFLEREQERGKEMGFFSVWRRRSHVCLIYRSWARPHLRAARTNSLRGVRTVWHPDTDGPLLYPEPSVLPRAPSNRADGPCRTGGRSARYNRTVWPTVADSPSSFFLFSLIYFEIKIWIWIFWDHCSWIMKEIFHMRQCT